MRFESLRKAVSNVTILRGTSGSESPLSEGSRQTVVCALLSGLTLLCYAQIVQNGFINLDDPDYITNNPQVKAGLSWQGSLWAFSTGHACNWHPVTWLSHMLDCQLYGLNPAGHHLTNLLLHLANSLLVFCFFKRTTNALWRSALVAALFAVHPLHVESVAWASERKDVLSTFFFLLTLIAYSNYVRASRARTPIPGDGKPLIPTPHSAPRHFYYFIALTAFAFGLMSKPMVVTLPCVLLLLDLWPLQRFQFHDLKISPTKMVPLVLEKIPFLILAFLVSAVTFFVQRAGGAVSSLASSSLTNRTENALVSYLRYLSKLFYPADLSVFYPFPNHWPIHLVICSFLVLALITVICIRLVRPHPYLAVGWLWFVGTLIPAIGLVQVGAQSMADRYMYIPSIGLLVLLVWAWPYSPQTGLLDKFIRPAAASIAVLACSLCTVAQLPYWKTDETLLSHAISVGCWEHLDRVQYSAADSARMSSNKLRRDSLVWFAQAHYDLGTRLMNAGRSAEGIEYLQTAIKLDPKYRSAYSNLGKALLEQRQFDEATAAFTRALALQPDMAEAHYNLGTALIRQSRIPEATAEFCEALRLAPNYAEAHMNVGIALMTQGRRDEALTHFAESVRLQPMNPEARFNLGLALLQANRPGEAAAQFDEELRLQPQAAKAHYRLATAMAQLGKPKEAISHYQETLRLAPDFSQAAQELAMLQNSVDQSSGPVENRDSIELSHTAGSN